MSLRLGTPSARNQARYDASHLERLDLIRALQEVADLPLDVVRDVLRQVDEPFGEGDPVAAATAALLIPVFTYICSRLWVFS